MWYAMSCEKVFLFYFFIRFFISATQGELSVPRWSTWIAPHAEQGLVQNSAFPQETGLVVVQWLFQLFIKNNLLLRPSLFLRFSSLCPWLEAERCFSTFGCSHTRGSCFKPYQVWIPNLAPNTLLDIDSLPVFPLLLLCRQPEPAQGFFLLKGLVLAAVAYLGVRLWARAKQLETVWMWPKL